LRDPLETNPRAGNQFDQVDQDSEKRSKKNPEYCKQAKQNLEALTSSPQVKVRNDPGEVRMLTPEQMELERSKAREKIQKYCD
jgi:hypothetical protein